MAIWGSFTTSTMAMMAHSHAMGQISTNIANVNTTSYKEVETGYQTLKSHRSQSYNMFGVQTTDTRRVEAQGVPLATGRDYDLAINGGGFFITNTEADGSGETLYTRDGAFNGARRQLAVDTDGNGQNDQSTLLVTQGGRYIMGWPANADGTFSTALGAVEFNSNTIVPGQATSSISLDGNVANVNGQSSSPTYQTSLPVVSTAGGTEGASTKRHNVTMSWSKVSQQQNAWTLGFPTGGDVASATVTPPTVLFQGDGRLDTANGADTVNVTVTWNDGSDPTTFTVDLSKMTQYSDTTGLSVSTTQNGYVDGRLQRTAFDSQGVLHGFYDNGTSRPLYKLPLATFPAPQNLEALNGNSYRLTDESGDPTLHSLEDENSIAKIAPGALESSSVSLEDQFTRMITTQKAYSSSATAFKTSDEMLQEVRNLKR